MAESTYRFILTIEAQQAIDAAVAFRQRMIKELSGTPISVPGMDSLKTGFQEAGQAAEKMSQDTQKAYNTIITANGRVVATWDRATDEFRNNGQVAAQAISNIATAEQQAEQTIRDTTASVNQQAEAFRNVDEYTARYQRDIAAMRQAQQQQTFQLPSRAAGYSMRTAGRSMMFAGTAITGSLAAAAKSYIDYNREMERSARNMELDATLTDKLNEKLLEISRNTAMFSPKELAEGLYYWASGTGEVINSEEDLNRILAQTTDIQKLAYMNMADLGTTTKQVGAIMGEFGLKTSDVSNIVGVLNYSAARSFAEVGDMGEAFKMVGPVAKGMGVTLEETAVVLQALADRGLRGSMAGRALRQMLIQLTQPSEEAKKSLAGLFGPDWQKKLFPQGKFVGLAKFIEMLAGSTHKMTQEQKMSALATMATANEMPALIALVDEQTKAHEQGINVLRAREKLMAGLQDAETQAYEQFVEQEYGKATAAEDAASLWDRMWRQNEESDVHRTDQMKQRWETAMLSIGHAASEASVPLLETVSDIMKDVGDIATKYPDLVKVAGMVGAGTFGIGALINAAGNVVITANALATMVGAGKDIFGSGTQLQAAGMQLEAANLQLQVAGVKGAGAGGATAGVAGGLTLGKVIKGSLTGLLGAGAVVSVDELMKKLTGIEYSGYGDITSQARIFSSVFELAMLHGVDFFSRVFGLDIGPSPEKTRDVAAQRWEGLGKEYTAGRLDWMRQPSAAIPGEMEELWNEETARAFSEQELKALESWQDYLDKREKMVANYNDRLSDLENDFNQSMLEFEQDYLKRRVELVEKAGRDTEKRRHDLEKRIAQVIADAEEKKAQAEENYQKKLRDIQERYEDSMEDAVRKRDARAILEAMRTRDRSMRDAKEERDERLKDIESDREQRIAELNKTFEEERKEREEENERRLAELDQQYAEERAKRIADYEDRRNELIQQRNEELAELDKAGRDKVASDLGWRKTVLADREVDFGKLLEQMKAFVTQEKAIWDSLYIPGELGMPNVNSGKFYVPSTYGGYATGGYAERGLAMLGERGREFVLNADTTRGLERDLGMLTQEKLMTLGGKAEISIAFSGVPTGIDQRGLEGAVYQAMEQVFGSAKTRSVR